MVPSVYKTGVRLRSEQDWEIIWAPEKEVAGIDAAVKNFSHQTLGKESAESSGPVKNAHVFWQNRCCTKDEYYNSCLLIYYKVRLCVSMKR